ncbi:PREDICTED: tetraspanin-15-like [Amphimedon queenslandica]|uniref:Tetraspanin n=1 Tax=Amphimedon queenslandica TaxID=400682 RepID=A0A1X7ULW6_AMPQE|nr:PREDICTED: tetraspanin-15-like [Amphimedon queenslandica]|eukprot:XP_019853584.1 PREDICTED: tetraspanin-15-like [Amphimedon queenslandica]
MLCSCCSGVLRLFLCCINILFFAIGATILTIGTLLITSSNDFTYITSDMRTGVILIIVMGSLLSCVSIVGVASTASAWKPLIFANVLVLVLLILLELTAGIYTMTSYSSLKSTVGEHMHEAIEKYEEESQYQEFVDFFQKNYNCCGYEDSSDWRGYHNNTKKLPNDCKCNGTLDNSICSFNERYKVTVWSKGCSDAIKDVIDRLSWSLGMTAIGLTIVQLLTLGLTVVFCLCKVIETKKSSSYALNDQQKLQKQ